MVGYHPSRSKHVKRFTTTQIATIEENVMGHEYQGMRGEKGKTRKKGGRGQMGRKGTPSRRAESLNNSPVVCTKCSVSHAIIRGRGQPSVENSLGQSLIPKAQNSGREGTKISTISSI
ncbi:hypothetical protein CDAR_10371 [Caerostris darwini]|uniref:Uncharacterized protein n=1 Tax=Caerostris darwini TaxID=1538125 RepID=A0AAV4RWM3_9ARAC|nr:hypothetical protein CDAR_10371 [Caerostris darwini]